LGLAEIAGQALLGVAAFLMADDHHGAAAEPGEAADDGGVVAVAAIAGDFVEIGEQEAGVVESVGAAGVAGELGALPGGDVGEELALQLGNVAPEAFEFDLGNAITGELAKLFDAFFEAFDGAFFMVAVHVPERVGILTRRTRRREEENDKSCSRLRRAKEQSARKGERQMAVRPRRTPLQSAAGQATRALPARALDAVDGLASAPLAPGAASSYSTAASPSRSRARVSRSASARTRNFVC